MEQENRDKKINRRSVFSLIGGGVVAAAAFVVSPFRKDEQAVGETSVSIHPKAVKREKRG